MYVYLHIPNHQKTHTMKNHKFYFLQISSDFTTVAANYFSSIENERIGLGTFKMTEELYMFYSIQEMAFFYSCLTLVYKVPESAFDKRAAMMPMPEGF